MFLLEQEYNENYTKKELELIAGYYDISKRKKEIRFNTRNHNI